MARPIRVEFGGAVYHVMARGNQGRKIYADDGDRQMWLATLVEAWRRTGWRIHAWVLMGNHYHLLLETPEPNLVLGMKWLQGTYTQRYNARHHLRGHLFQGRYRAVPVETADGQYFQAVSSYIHLNPARASLIRIGEQKLWEYRWSSYPHYARGKPPEWLVTERVLGSLGLGPAERSGYETYLESRVLELGSKAGRRELEAAWRNLRRGWYVGGEGFGERLLARAKDALMGKQRESHAGPARTAHDQRHAETMLAGGLRALGMARAELARDPKGQLEKQVLAWWIFGRTVVTRRWLAEQLHMGYESAISRAVSFVESSRVKSVVAMKVKLQSAAANPEENVETAAQ
jgi:REP element-mobilizing transposase RayT